MKQLQKITIVTYENGYEIVHKHVGFGEEVYLPKSRKGILNMVENMLNGYQPDPQDVCLTENEKPNIHNGAWKEPRLLD